MLTHSNDLKNLLYQNSSIKIGSECTIEYNMNSLLDNIVVTYDSAIESSYARYKEKINVFKKLFPVDSIIKPFRPVNSGVKYYILSSTEMGATAINNKAFLSYQSNDYATDKTRPRIYYPALEAVYKYWVTPINTKVDVTVKYIQSSVSIESIYSTGSKASPSDPIPTYENRVICTTATPHGFTSGQIVSISGTTSSSLNSALVNQEINSIISPTKFLIINNVAATSATGGTVQLRKKTSDSPLTYANTSTKPALANKITVKFDKYHYLPSTANLTITYSDNTTASVSASIASSGLCDVYWSGSSWSTTRPYTDAQPIAWPAPKEIKSIKVETAAAPSDRVIALIEIAPKWVKSISSDVVSFNIQKESSMSEDSVLPVGVVSANNLQISLAKYDKDYLKIIPYNRLEDWTTTPVPNDVIYIYKDVQINPYISIYHSNGTVTEGSLKYDRFAQGTYFINDYGISSYGDTTINALDGVKYLSQVIPINLYLKDCPITSIISCLLDSVGFTNYEISTTSTTADPDPSVPFVRYWWTEDQKTAWDSIQDLCRDAQINAFFDENNILRIQSRDYFYKKEAVTADWNFYESASGSNLPNIINFSKKEIVTANQVKVVWKTPILSTYSQTNDTQESLWTSGTSYITAGGLRNSISATQSPESINFSLNFSVGDNYGIVSSFNFSGYFLVDSEIFEYNGIEYNYTLLSDGKEYSFFASSADELSAYRAISDTTKPFLPTGRFRIVDRGVFNTTKAFHESAGSPNLSQWSTLKDEEWGG